MLKLEPAPGEVRRVYGNSCHMPCHHALPSWPAALRLPVWPHHPAQTHPAPQAFFEPLLDTGKMMGEIDAKLLALQIPLPPVVVRTGSAGGAGGLGASPLPAVSSEPSVAALAMAVAELSAAFQPRIQRLEDDRMLAARASTRSAAAIGASEHACSMCSSLN